MTAAKRHRWGNKIAHPHKTERECLNGCGIVKVTRHEGNSHWNEFWRDLERISVDRVPACEPVEEGARV